MATLTAISPTLAGVVKTLSAVALTDEIPNPDGKMFYEVANGSGGSINVTFTSQTVGPESQSLDLVVAVGAGVTKIIGPFKNKKRWNNTNGRVAVAHSSITTVTARAIRVLV